jgi:hypothetical protein
VEPGYGTARILATAAASLWLVTQAFTAWAMVISPPPEPWYAQLQPSHDRYPAVFTDRILGLSVGSIQIPHSAELPGDESDAMRKQLLAGAPLRVVVANVDATRAEAPIAIISGGPVHDVVWWAQDGLDGIFSIAVRGTLLGLRTPSVRIADVVPAVRGDTIVLSGSYRDGWYELQAENRTGVRHRALRASPSWGWAFLLPLPLYAFGSTAIGVTALYLALVGCLLGYWNARSVGAATPAVPITGISIAILLGLGVVPTIFGLPIAHWSEWLAAIGGGVAGWTIARHQTKAKLSG